MNTINLNDYILIDETNACKGTIWLHKLPNDETLFDVIDKLREVHKEETLVFTEEIKIIGKTITKNIQLSKCVFLEKVSFIDNVWKNYLFISNITFCNKIIFIDNVWKDYLSILDITFCNKVFFHKNTFEKDLRIEQIISLEQIEVDNSFFNKLIICGIFQQDIKFISCEVKGKTEILPKTIFTQEVSFMGSKFYESIDLSKIEFKGKTTFQNCTFEGNVRFHDSKFYNFANFKNTTFKSLVDFYNVHFYKAQQFHLTDFLDRAIFSNTIFYEEAQFLYNKVENDSYINFESAKFKRGLDISRSNFNCNLNFLNVKIDEEGDEYIFKHLEEVKYKDDFRKYKKGAIPSVYKQLRETYRIIKNNFYSQNNRIEGLRFHKKEMLVYEKEIKSNSSKNNEDKILLLANKISSNFGTSWSRGVLFTVSAGIITLLPISCNLKFSLTSEGIGNFLKALVDILNLTDWNDMTILGEKLTNWQYIFLFIGRIFIAYGIYQTVQAFRKYGKS